MEFFSSLIIVNVNRNRVQFKENIELILLSFLKKKNEDRRPLISQFKKKRNPFRNWREESKRLRIFLARKIKKRNRI